MPKESPAEIMALIHTALDAFNRKDSAVFNSVHGDEREGGSAAEGVHPDPRVAEDDV